MSIPILGQNRTIPEADRLAATTVLYLPLWIPKTSPFASLDSYGHTVTAGGVPVWTPQGYIFDGIDDGLSIPDSALWSFGTGSFSIQIVVKLSEAAPAARRTLIASTLANVSNSNTFALFQGQTEGNWQVSMETTNKYWPDASAANISTFQHITLVRQTGINDVYIYINGVQLTPGAAFAIKDVDFNWDGVFIGKSWGPSYGKGIISEAIIYSGKALTQSEVTNSYLAAKRRMPWIS